MKVFSLPRKQDLCNLTKDASNLKDSDLIIDRRLSLGKRSRIINMQKILRQMEQRNQFGAVRL